MYPSLGLSLCSALLPQIRSRRIFPADGQASHLPRLFRQAAQAAGRAHPRPRGRRPGRALDHLVQPRHLHAGAAARAHPRGGLRGLRVRPRRLDRRRPARPRSPGSRPGLAARQRGLRGRSLRRRAGHAPDLHPPCERRQAAERSPGPHLRALRRRGHRGRDAGDEREAAEGDRDRGATRPDRGALVAAFPDRADRPGALGREPARGSRGTATGRWS